MTRVLVTGASGLLGRRVAERLAEAGAEVTRTSRSGALGTLVADMTRPMQTSDLVENSRPEVVLHLAGGRAEGPGRVYAANVLTTVHLLEAVARFAPEAYVVVSGSAAEYGDGAGVPLGETAACMPVNDYGRAKLAQTQLARVMAAELGLQLLVVRPFNVVAHDLPSSAALGNVRRQLLAETGPVRRLVCGRTDVRRDFIVADDVAHVVARLVEERPDVPVLNLCSGLGVALREVIAGVATALGVEVDLHADADLMAIPASELVVGDPTTMFGLGHRLDGSVPALVEALLQATCRV